MTIRIKIRIFAVIFFTVAMLIVSAYGFVLRPMERSFQKLAFSIEYRGDLFALSALQHDYLDHHSARAATQWRVLADRSLARMNEPYDWSASELEVIQKMRQEQDLMYSIVKNLLLSEPIGKVDSEEFLNTLDQAESLSLRLTEDVDKLSRIAMAEMMRSIEFNTPIFFGLILALVIIAFILLAFLQRTVIGPMGRLEGYTRSISDNQTSFTIDASLLRQRDEVGSLARVLQGMYQKIQDARAELEQRVVERTKDLEAFRLKAETHANTAERLNRLTIGRELKMLELKKEIQRLKGEQGKDE